MALIFSLVLGPGIIAECSEVIGSSLAPAGRSPGQVANPMLVADASSGATSDNGETSKAESGKSNEDKLAKEPAAEWSGATQTLLPLGFAPSIYPTFKAESEHDFIP